MVIVLSTEAKTMCRNTVRHTHNTESHSYTLIQIHKMWHWVTVVGPHTLNKLGWMGVLAGNLNNIIPGFRYSWHCCWVIMCLEGRRIHTSQQKRLIHPSKWNVPSQCSRWDSACPPHPILSQTILSSTNHTHWIRRHGSAMPSQLGSHLEFTISLL